MNTILMVIIITAMGVDIEYQLFGTPAACTNAATTVRHLYAENPDVHIGTSCLPAYVDDNA